VSSVGRRPEIYDGPDVEGSTAGPEEINGEPAAAEDRADVAWRLYLNASHAEVARLHPRQMVYQYLHIPPTG
jgi:hypothetical protein